MIWIVIGLIIAAIVSRAIIPSPHITGLLFIGAFVLFAVWIFK